MDPGIAWTAGIVTMLALFIIVYWREGKLRLALVYALVWGKILATVYWLLGIDVPVFTIYTVEDGVLVKHATITANILIFTSFLATNIIILSWPEIRRELNIKEDIV